MSFFNRYQTTIYASILLFGIIWIGISAKFFKPDINSRISTPQKGFSAPEIDLFSLNGIKYNLSDFKGEVILVNIWASWCKPCRAEMPVMQRVYEKYQGEGFTILAVNATKQDNINAVTNFSEEHGLTFPILLDLQGEVTSNYLVNAFPSSYFINREGKIQDIFIGGPMNEAYLISRIEEMLK